MDQPATVSEQLDSCARMLELSLEVTDPNVIGYLIAFADDQVRAAKALEALTVGVIAIRSASPTLDTTVVQAKFSDLEVQMKEYLDEFMTAVRDDLTHYFKDQDGIVPRSINGVFGQDGRLSRTFQDYFDPAAGKLASLMQAQIGPTSSFGRALDPKNKEGILTQVETRINELVDSKMTDMLGQLSLDQEKSAMSRLHRLLSDSFSDLRASLGIKAGAAAEAERGHVKGIEFEAALYDIFAAIGRQLGDNTEFVRGTPGVEPRRKTGDYVATLDETAGAPGLRVVVEVKNQPVKLKEAIQELEEAKKNRASVIGIYVFAKGCEPPEVGDFRRIGEDFYCTVEKDALSDGSPLVFFEAAYKVARALAVATARKSAASALDLQRIKDHVDALVQSSKALGEILTKAKTVKSSGEQIEQAASTLKQQMETRLQEITMMLSAGAAS